MSNMKCPFCGQELKNINFVWFCENESCKAYDWTMEEAAWQELIYAHKTLDVAKKGLQELKNIIACPPDVSYENCVSMYADGVLQEITNSVLDYKEPTVTHNKIEFPEYNDGLLEEFDKQFLESGQDDDLTEMALEQKDV